MTTQLTATRRNFPLSAKPAVKSGSSAALNKPAQEPSLKRTTAPQHIQRATTPRGTPLFPSVVATKSVWKNFPQNSHTPKSKFTSIATQACISSPQVLLMGDTFAQGGSGKMKKAVDAQGRVTAIKVLRTYKPNQWQEMSEQMRLAPPTHLNKTNLVSDEEAIGEAVLMQTVRRGIDRACNTPGTTDYEYLTPFRRDAAPVNIYAIFTLPAVNLIQKFAIHMDLESGDLYDLAHQVKRLDKDAVGLLVTSATAQIFTELAAMHKMGWLHNDLKPENCTWNYEGQIKLMDFGLTTKMDASHGTFVPNVAYGTYLTPEHLKIVPGKGLETRHLTKASDVWNAAALIFGLAETQIVSPFGIRRFQSASDGSINQTEARAFFWDFANYRDQLFANGEKPFSLDAVKQADMKFFGPLSEYQPEIFTLLMRHAFDPDPATRWSAGKIADEAQDMASRHPKADFDDLLETIKWIGDREGHDDLIEEGRQFFVSQNLPQTEHAAA